VTLDGTAPGGDHGMDSSADGQARFASRGCTSSSGRRGECKTGPLKSNSPIGGEVFSFTFG